MILFLLLFIWIACSAVTGVFWWSSHTIFGIRAPAAEEVFALGALESMALAIAGFVIWLLISWYDERGSR